MIVFTLRTPCQKPCKPVLNKLSPTPKLTTVLATLLMIGSVLVTCSAKSNDSAAKAEVQAIFSSVTSQQSPGLAVLVQQNGRIVFQRGYGARELRSFAPNGQQTDFRLASCTKQFTAMAVMLLVHDGKLRYDEPLTEIFPGFPAYGRSITVRNLLNHTSGLPDYEELMEKAGGVARWTPERQISDSEVLALLESESRGKFAPGTQWSYSNSGYVVLGLVVAKVSGEPFAQFLRERIFASIGMSQTLAYE